jgi:hypothetical protein
MTDAIAIIIAGIVFVLALLFFICTLDGGDE